MALNGKEFSNFNVDLSKFEKIILANLPADLAPTRAGNADLYNLIATFKTKTNMPDSMRKDKRFDTRLFYDVTAALREIKTPEEKLMIRKAVEISCQGQNEVMKAVRPDMSELEIQGLHEFVHKKQGAESVGYGSIIGAGENGCVLH